VVRVCALAGGGGAGGGGAGVREFSETSTVRVSPPFAFFGLRLASRPERYELPLLSLYIQPRARPYLESGYGAT
jgi:hypothetical protein